MLEGAGGLALIGVVLTEGKLLTRTICAKRIEGICTLDDKRCSDRDVAIERLAPCTLMPSFDSLTTEICRITVDGRSQCSTL